MNCRNCGKVLKNHQIYCNNKCQTDYQFNDYINKWKKGLKNGLKGKYQVSNHVRRYLFEKYDNKCGRCGWKKKNLFTNEIPLEIEHIDGNYLNNSEDNLILLCPNCHSLTATYKGANIGYGRKDRKKYSLYGNPELK